MKNEYTNNIEVKLNKTEQELAKIISRKRTKANRDLGTKSGLLDFRYKKTAELDGFCGELVVAKALNFYPDLSTFVRSGGADLFDRYGFKIDVKTTRYKNGHLLVNIPTDKKGNLIKDKVNEVDFYYLVIGEFPTYNIKGYMPANEIITDENIDYDRQAAAWCVSQNDLYPIPLEWVNEDLIKDKR